MIVTPPCFDLLLPKPLIVHHIFISWRVWSEKYGVLIGIFAAEAEEAEALTLQANHSNAFHTPVCHGYYSLNVGSQPRGISEPVTIRLFFPGTFRAVGLRSRGRHSSNKENQEGKGDWQVSMYGSRHTPSTGFRQKARRGR